MTSLGPKALPVQTVAIVGPGDTVVLLMPGPVLSMDEEAHIRRELEAGHYGVKFVLVTGVVGVLVQRGVGEEPAREDAADSEVALAAIAAWQADNYITVPFEQIAVEADARDAATRPGRPVGGP